MKKFLAICICIQICTKLFAQQFSIWGVTPNGYLQDTCLFYGDTMRFSFSGLPSGAFGNLKICIYYEGDFGNTNEFSENFLAQFTTGNNVLQLANNGPNSFGFDCAPMDSTILFIPVSIIQNLGNSFTIKNIPSNTVDFICPNITTKIRIEGTYCTNGFPAQFANINNNDTSLCQYQQLILKGNLPGGLFSGPGIIDTQFVATNLLPGIYTIHYIAADSIGCTTSDSIKIEILSSPAVLDTIDVCFGNAAVLSPSGSLLFGFFIDENLQQSIDTATTFTFSNITNDKIIYITFYDSVSGMGSCYAKTVLKVKKINLGNDVEFCQGQSATFSIGLGYSSITWNGNTTNLNSFSVNSSQQVIIEVIDTGGCTLTDTAIASVLPLPVVILNLQPTITCLNYDSIVLQGGLPVGGYYFGNGITDSIFYPQQVGLGNHTVNYTYFLNGCSAVAQGTIVVDDCLSITQENTNKDILIYPNPFNDRIFINSSKNIDIILYDNTSKELLKLKNNSTQTLELSNLNSGIYFLVINNGEKIITQKIIKQ